MEEYESLSKDRGNCSITDYKKNYKYERELYFEKDMITRYTIIRGDNNE